MARNITNENAPVLHRSKPAFSFDPLEKNESKDQQRTIDILSTPDWLFLRLQSDAREKQQEQRERRHFI